MGLISLHVTAIFTTLDVGLGLHDVKPKRQLLPSIAPSFNSDMGLCTSAQGMLTDAIKSNHSRRQHATQGHRCIADMSRSAAQTVKLDMLKRWLMSAGERFVCSAVSFDPKLREQRLEW